MLIVIDINASVFENLRGGKNSDRYEYILPNNYQNSVNSYSSMVCRYIANLMISC